MNNLNESLFCKHIHFIGVGGIGMSALAKYALFKGCTVSGSDSFPSELTLELQQKGAKIKYKHSAFNVKGADIVVYSSAISKNNPELKKAFNIGVPVIRRSKLLDAVMRRYNDRIAVSGSHGKTTATAMLTSVLSLGGLDPTSFIGGEDKRFSNCLIGNGKVAIAEACEYKKNFLDLSPTVAVVLNIDNDHMESYGSMEALKQAFSQFASAGIAVVNADDVNCRELNLSCSVSFGINNSAVYTAKNIVKNKNGYSFTVYKHGKRCVRINLSVMGRHNIYNALASFAVADIFKIKHFCIKQSLEAFDGVKRRCERLGELFGAEVYADYAHHPKEIYATLKAFACSDKDVIVFQPHTYSRTKLLMNDFISCFKAVKNLIIYKTYPAREKLDKKGDAKTLYSKLKDADINTCTYADDIKCLIKSLKELKNPERIIFIGAGDIYSVAKKLLK